MKKKTMTAEEMNLPDFTISPDIEGLALKIVETVEKMEKLGDIDLLFKLRKASRISSIHSSVSIEANSLSLEEVTDIINGKKVLGDPREIMEVKNAWNAYEGIDEYRPYSIDDFLLAHQKMSDKLVREAGKFRSIEVGVYKGFTLIHEGAKPHEINTLMDAAFEWGIKSNAHPLIKSCVLHFLIEYVHPFEDGNGRMGRLWQTVILSDWHTAFQWIPIETLVYQNQYGYYEALRSSEQNNDAAIFVRFMLEIIGFTLEAIIRSKSTPKYGRGETIALPYFPDFSRFTDKSGEITDKSEGITDKSDKITDKIPACFIEKLTEPEKEFLFAIFPHLCEHGEIGNYRARTLTNKSAESVKKYFAKLVQIGFLQAIGKSKSRVYRFADFV
jgi:Fic family protein